VSGDSDFSDFAGADAAASAGFGSIGIVGLGLIGGSLALAIRERHPGMTIAGVDRAEVIDEAMRTGAIDRSALDASGLGDVDLIVLAAPVLQNVACLQQLAAEASLLHEMSGGAIGSRRRPLITDVGSTKRLMVDVVRARPGALRFVGGHPMAGAAQGGLAFARADLFEGRPWLVTSDVAQAGDVERLAGFVCSLGAVPRVLGAAEHDELMAFISHMPQIVSSALMQTVGERVGEAGLQLSGPGLADTTRLASSPAGVWTDICETNADLIDAAIDAIQSELHAARQRLRTPADLAEWLGHGARWRTRMPPRA
jgi:prephenate dehydrogenase